MATFSSDDVSLDTSGLVLGNTDANMIANSTTLAISSGVNLINSASGTIIGDIGILTEGGGWDFAGYQNNGFSFVGGTATPGIDGITLTTTVQDPNFISPVISINGGTYRFLKIEYERITHSTPPGWDGSIFYSTGGHGASESYKARAPQATGSGVRDSVYIDMAAAAGAPDWSISTITAIRFDFDSFPGGVVKIYSIKYYSMAQGSVFDSNTNQSSYACGIKYNANSGYIGKTLSASSVISKAVTYGSNNVGYVSSFNVELRLYGKTGSAPANATDGTLLANVSFLDINGNVNPITLASNNLVTQWAHAWITIIPDTANSSLRMGELELYGKPSNSTLITANGIVADGMSVNGLTSYSFSSQLLTANAGTFFTTNTNTLAVSGSATVSGNAVALMGVENQVLTGGITVTEKDLGTISAGGTVTLDMGDRPIQKYNANGAHTLAPGAVVGSCLVIITNGSSAGAITTSGWTKVDGDSYTTTSGHKFVCHASVSAAGSLLILQAMQ